MAKQISDSLLQELYMRMPKVILSAYTKKELYEYRPLMESLALDFIQYNKNGNLWFISLDMDYKMDIEQFYDVCTAHFIPMPTIFLETTKGFHAHWFLENFISKHANEGQQYFSDIKKHLVRVLDADPHASGKIRVFRNPLTHAHTYNPTAYGLNDFREFLDAAKKSVKVTKSQCKTRFTSNINISTISVGERNISCFNYLRQFGYSIWGNADRTVKVETEAFSINSQLTEPLPEQELIAIVHSVNKWLDDHYDPYKKAKRARDEVIEYNRTLAKKRSSLAVAKVLEFFLIRIGDITLAELRKISLRDVAAHTRQSKNTVQKYRDEVLKNIMKKLLEEAKIAQLAWTVVSKDGVTAEELLGISVAMVNVVATEFLVESEKLC